MQALKVEQVTLLPTGNLLVNFEKSKTNQSRQRLQNVIGVGTDEGSSFDPVRVIMEYKNVLQATAPSVLMMFPNFKSVVTSEQNRKLVPQLGVDPISYDSARKFLKVLLLREELSPLAFHHNAGLHSFRTGLITTMVGEGVAVDAVQRQVLNAVLSSILAHVTQFHNVLRS